MTIKEERERARKQQRIEAGNTKVMKSEYLSSRPMMGYDRRYVHFIFAGARGRGKSVLALDAPIASCKKYGYENNKIFFFRLSDMSIKALLQNKASNLIDPILIDKYKMEITRKANVVFDHGKKLLEVYSLASAAKMKGQALFDYNFLNNRPIDPKTGKPVKRFVWLILDEFQMAEGLENKSAATRSTAALFKMYTEIITRDQQFLDYPAVRCIYLANTVSESSTFTSEMWGFYMPPGDFRIKKCPRKNAVFFNVPNSERYIEKRKASVMGSITDFENDSNYSNQIAMDMKVIKPKKTRLMRVTYLIKFSKNPSDWFCLYDNKYLRKYRGESIKKDKVIAMRRHIDEVFNSALITDVFDRYDVKDYMYADIISMACFRARMSELKAK
jgi:hypothetical protein